MTERKRSASDAECNWGPYHPLVYSGFHTGSASTHTSPTIRPGPSPLRINQGLSAADLDPSPLDSPAQTPVRVQPWVDHSLYQHRDAHTSSKSSSELHNRDPVSHTPPQSGLDPERSLSRTVPTNLTSLASSQTHLRSTKATQYREGDDDYIGTAGTFLFGVQVSSLYSQASPSTLKEPLLGSAGSYFHRIGDRSNLAALSEEFIQLNSSPNHLGKKPSQIKDKGHGTAATTPSPSSSSSSSSSAQVPPAYYNPVDSGEILSQRETDIISEISSQDSVGLFTCQRSVEESKEQEVERGTRCRSHSQVTSESSDIHEDAAVVSAQLQTPPGKARESFFKRLSNKFAKPKVGLLDQVNFDELPTIDDLGASSLEYQELPLFTESRTQPAKHELPHGEYVAPECSPLRYSSGLGPSVREPFLPHSDIVSPSSLSPAVLPRFESIQTKSSAFEELESVSVQSSTETLTRTITGDENRHSHPFSCRTTPSRPRASSSVTTVVDSSGFRSAAPSVIDEADYLLTVSTAFGLSEHSESGANFDHLPSEAGPDLDSSSWEGYVCASLVSPERARSIASTAIEETTQKSITSVTSSSPNWEGPNPSSTESNSSDAAPQVTESQQQASEAPSAPAQFVSEPSTWTNLLPQALFTVLEYLPGLSSTSGSTEQTTSTSQEARVTETNPTPVASPVPTYVSPQFRPSSNLSTQESEAKSTQSSVDLTSTTSRSGPLLTSRRIQPGRSTPSQSISYLPLSTDPYLLGNQFGLAASLIHYTALEDTAVQGGIENNSSMSRSPQNNHRGGRRSSHSHETARSNGAVDSSAETDGTIPVVGVTSDADPSTFTCFGIVCTRRKKLVIATIATLITVAAFIIAFQLLELTKIRVAKLKIAVKETCAPMAMMFDTEITLSNPSAFGVKVKKPVVEMTIDASETSLFASVAGGSSETLIANTTLESMDLGSGTNTFAFHDRVLNVISDDAIVAFVQNVSVSHEIPNVNYKIYVDANIHFGLFDVPYTTTLTGSILESHTFGHLLTETTQSLADAAAMRVHTVQAQSVRGNQIRESVLYDGTQGMPVRYSYRGTDAEPASVSTFADVLSRLLPFTRMGTFDLDPEAPLPVDPATLPPNDDTGGNEDAAAEGTASVESGANVFNSSSKSISWSAWASIGLTMPAGTFSLRLPRLRIALWELGSPEHGLDAMPELSTKEETIEELYFKMDKLEPFPQTSASDSPIIVSSSLSSIAMNTFDITTPRLPNYGATNGPNPGGALLSSPSVAIINGTAVIVDGNGISNDIYSGLNGYIVDLSPVDLFQQSLITVEYALWRLQMIDPALFVEIDPVTLGNVGKNEMYTHLNASIWVLEDGIERLKHLARNIYYNNAPTIAVGGAVPFWAIDTSSVIMNSTGFTAADHIHKVMNRGIRRRERKTFSADESSAHGEASRDGVTTRAIPNNRLRVKPPQASFGFDDVNVARAVSQIAVYRALKEARRGNPEPARQILALRKQHKEQLREAIATAARGVYASKRGRRPAKWAQALSVWDNLRKKGKLRKSAGFTTFDNQDLQGDDTSFDSDLSQLGGSCYLQSLIDRTVLPVEVPSAGPGTPLFELHKLALNILSTVSNSVASSDLFSDDSEPKYLDINAIQAKGAVREASVMDLSGLVPDLNPSANPIGNLTLPPIADIANDFYNNVTGGSDNTSLIPIPNPGDIVGGVTLPGSSSNTNNNGGDSASDSDSSPTISSAIPPPTSYVTVEYDANGSPITHTTDVVTLSEFDSTRVVRLMAQTNFSINTPMLPNANVPLSFIEVYRYNDLVGRFTLPSFHVSPNITSYDLRLLLEWSRSIDLSFRFVESLFGHSGSPGIVIRAPKGSSSTTALVANLVERAVLYAAKFVRHAFVRYGDQLETSVEDKGDELALTITMPVKNPLNFKWKVRGAYFSLGVVDTSKPPLDPAPATSRFTLCTIVNNLIELLPVDALILEGIIDLPTLLFGTAASMTDIFASGGESFTSTHLMTSGDHVNLEQCASGPRTNSWCGYRHPTTASSVGGETPAQNFAFDHTHGRMATGFVPSSSVRLPEGYPEDLLFNDQKLRELLLAYAAQRYSRGQASASAGTDRHAETFGALPIGPPSVIIPGLPTSDTEGANSSVTNNDPTSGANEGLLPPIEDLPNPIPSLVALTPPTFNNLTSAVRSAHHSPSSGGGSSENGSEANTDYPGPLSEEPLNTNFESSASSDEVVSPTGEWTIMADGRVDPFTLSTTEDKLKLKLSYFPTRSSAKFLKNFLVGEDVTVKLGGVFEADYIGKVDLSNVSLSLGGHNYFLDIFRNLKVRPSIGSLNPLTQQCAIHIDVSAEIHKMRYFNLMPVNATAKVYMHDDDGLRPFFGPLQDPAYVTKATIIVNQEPGSTSSFRMTVSDFDLCLRLGARLLRGNVIMDLRDIVVYLRFSNRDFRIGFDIPNIRVKL